MNCSICGADNAASAKFCTSCGAPLAETFLSDSSALAEESNEPQAPIDATDDKKAKKIPICFRMWFIILLLCSWFGTIPGLILFVVRLKKYPDRKKGAWTGFGVTAGIVVVLIAVAIYFGGEDQRAVDRYLENGDFGEAIAYVDEHYDPANYSYYSTKADIYAAAGDYDAAARSIVAYCESVSDLTALQSDVEKRLAKYQDKVSAETNAEIEMLYAEMSAAKEEKEAREQAEREAQEAAAREQAEREAQEAATREQAEREAQEAAAREQTENEGNEVTDYPKDSSHVGIWRGMDQDGSDIELILKTDTFELTIYDSYNGYMIYSSGAYRKEEDSLVTIDDTAFVSDGDTYSALVAETRDRPFYMPSEDKAFFSEVELSRESEAELAQMANAYLSEAIGENAGREEAPQTAGAKEPTGKLSKRTVKRPNDFKLGDYLYTFGEVTLDDIKNGYDCTIDYEGAAGIELNGTIAFKADDSGLVNEVGSRSKSLCAYKDIHAGQTSDEIYKKLGSPSDRTSYYESWIYNEKGKQLSMNDFQQYIIKNGKAPTVYTISVYFDSGKASSIVLSFLNG